MSRWSASAFAVMHAMLVTMASGASAQGSADPIAALRRQVAELGLIAWSAQRPLQWVDFRATPQSSDNAAAQTASNFLYSVSCRDSVVDVASVATFWPTRSWVRSDIPRQAAVSTRTLLHERGHFNISELFARRFRRAVANAKELCPNRSYNAGRLFDEQNAANEEMQDRYDRETAHGQEREAQVRWDAAIRASLDSLAAYGGQQ